MKKIAFLVAAVAVFAAWPLSTKLGPLVGPVTLVALAVAMALAASGAATALAVAGGALGAFAGSVLGSVTPAVGGAALVGLCFAERTLRVRTAPGRLLHVGAALASGALAAAIAHGYATAALPVHAVALVVAAVLVALPLLVEADDPVAHALDQTAAAVSEPARSDLRNGAELRRTADVDVLDGRSQREVRATWRTLLRLAEARLRLERGAVAENTHAHAVRRKVDERIADHVSVLVRAYAAVDAARAAEASLDDRALRRVENVGESLEQVSKALVEDALEPEG